MGWVFSCGGLPPAGGARLDGAAGSSSGASWRLMRRSAGCRPPFGAAAPPALARPFARGSGLLPPASASECTRSAASARQGIRAIRAHPE
eukprot:774074-Prorocentrum_minimum.AAC.2